jgi:nucleoside-diphosphate-sugar epimerase
VKVLVTGSSSHLARALLARLCANERVTGVTGIDRAPPRIAHAKFRALELDIRDPSLPALLGGHDALVHLAFVVLRGHMSEAEMFDVNVTASHKLFRAARSAGIRRLVHMSSAAVYGGGTGLTENAPFAPVAHFLYARHKAQLEHLLAGEIPECVRLRPHVILGPNAHPLLRQLLDLPCYPALPEPQPRLQCVHEDDVARAVVLALAGHASGPFNLAVEDSFSYREAIRVRHRISLPIPPRLARAVGGLAWRLWAWGGEPAWLAGFEHSLVLDCRRAAVELGWTSRYDAARVLAETLKS